MATETWHYQENQFDNATKESFKLMNIINADHIAKLQAQQADPDIAALLARTTAPHNAYALRYATWFSAKGIYKGETDRVDGHLNDLSSLKIKQWDIQIQQQFLEGTSDYIGILPDRRIPFQQGGIDERISHLQSLAQRLAAYPALASTMNDVLAFHTTLDDARDVQQQKEELVNDASDLLETARLAIALMMYRNLGFLIDKYAATPELISNFWELQLLRSPVSDEEPPSPTLVTFFTAVTNQNVLQGFNIGIRGEAVTPEDGLAGRGDEVSINWGDGNISDITLDGSTQNTPHSYLTPGIYNIEVKGDHPERIIELLITHAALTNAQPANNLTALEILNLEYNPITNFTLPGTLAALNYVSFFQDALSVTSMNSLLQVVNGYNTSNGTLLLHGGTNAVPTGQGNAAKNQLESRGWTVATN